MNSKITIPSARKIIFLLVLFIYIYAPPFSFVPLGINKLIAPLIIVWLLFNYKSLTNRILLQKHLFIGICLLIASIAYSFIIDSSTIYAGGLAFTRKYTFSQTMILIEVLPITLFLSIYAIRKLKFTLVDFINSLVIVAGIQSLLAIIMLVLPGVRMFILSTILNYDPNEDKIFREDLFGFRGFGFSQDLLFSLSIVQGIALACVLSLCLYNFAKYKYTLFLIPPLLLSILLNARVGLVPVIVFILVITVMSLFKLRIYLLSRFTIFALVSCLVVYLGVFTVNTLSETKLEQNLEWAFDFFVEGKNFVSGSDGKTGNFGSITGKHWHLSDTSSERTFGEGKYLINMPNSSEYSDLGYVRNVYFGGYIYSLLSYSAMIFLFVGSKKKQLKAFQPLFYSLLLTLLLVHFKGDAFLPTPGYRIIFLTSVFAIAERRLKSSVPKANNVWIPQYRR